MSSSTLIRFCGLAAMAGGAAWVLLWSGGLGWLIMWSEVAPKNCCYYFDNVVVGLLELGAMAAIAALYVLQRERQRERYSLVGVLASLAAFIGLGLVFIDMVLIYGAAATGWRIPLSGVLFFPGLLSATVGLIALGILTIGAGSLPWWAGAALIVGSPLFLLLGTSFMWLVGEVAMVPVGAAWIVVGYAVFRAGTHRTERSSRVR